MRIDRFFVLSGVSLLLAAFWVLGSVERAGAQCGSQASSCKNCHEVQGQTPVNNDGTGWHQSHAFGDFCYICHAGNNTSMDQDEAHLGMVAPLSDVRASCQGCHPDNLTALAEVYATALGVEIGEGGGVSSGSSQSAAPPAAPAAQPPALVVDESQVIDYSRRYDETVLGLVQVNWGDVILGGLVVALALGGGSFVYWNERRLRGLPLFPAVARRVKTAATGFPIVEGYSPEVVALLPLVARLDPAGLHALKRLLADPDQASDLLQSLSRLDPELVRRIRALDREARSLLIALAGD